MALLRIFLFLVNVISYLGNLSDGKRHIEYVEAHLQKSPQPEQIHLSATGSLFSCMVMTCSNISRGRGRTQEGDPTEMTFTWVSMAPSKDSIVEYGLRESSVLSLRCYGTMKHFKDYCGNEHRTMYVHRVKLERLTPGESYGYRVGSDDGWSNLFMFNATRDGEDWSPRLAIYGDLGVNNAQSLSGLQKEVQHGQYDAILHIGDFAYDMHSDNSRIGDSFMNQIEPMAAYIPYMVAPGNHESACNFSNYKARFSMPGRTEGIYYSWNIGPVHIISISTELYFFLSYGIEQLVQQYRWLERDLQMANLAENRAKRPWILVMGHRPMYCSNGVGDDCQNHQNIIRSGLSSAKLFPLEELFYRYGVDVMFWAHEHSYERMLPVYNYKVYNGSLHEPFRNPRAPVHITTGSAGCRECHDKFDRDWPSWTAFRSLDYGYTRVQFFNRSHMYLEQVSIDKGNTVIDNFWLIKDKHGPEAWRVNSAVQFHIERIIKRDNRKSTSKT